MVTLPDVQQLNSYTPDATAPQAAPISASYTPGLAQKGMEQAATDTSDALGKLQDLHNEAAARDRQNQFMDYATNQDLEFRKLNGQAAVDAMPAFQQDYKNKIGELSQGLAPDAQQKFLTESNGYMSFVHRQMAEHAATEYTHSLLASATTAQSQAERLVLNNPTDPDAYEMAKKMSGDAAASIVQIKNGGGPADQANARQQAEDDMSAYRAKAYLDNLPPDQQFAQLQNSIKLPNPVSAPANLNAPYVKPYSETQVVDLRNKLSEPSQYDTAFQTAAQKYATQYGIDPTQLTQEAKLHGIVESGLNPSANNGKSQGLMQISNDNIKALGIDPTDPVQSIDAGTQILAQSIAKNKGDMKAVDAEYYGGTDAKQHGPNTQQYVENLAALRGDAQPVATGTPLDDMPTNERVTAYSKVVAQRAIQSKMDKNDTVNSPEGYDVIQRMLQPADSEHPNKIDTEDHLNSLLARTGPGGINIKDYNDAKPLLGADQTFKDTLSKNMQAITNANGNVDGKGQDRAMQWYQQVMTAKEANDKLGDKKLSDAEFTSKIDEKDGPLMPAPPSRMQQIRNWVSSIKGSAEDSQPGFGKMQTFASPDDPEFSKLAPGTKFKTPDGQTRTKK